MQTKSSYSVLKWAFLAGVIASTASACVVSSGDGDDEDTDITEGGDGGTSSNTAGKSTGGGGSSAGTTAGSSSSGAPTTDGGEPAMGTGGMPSGFVPGMCMDGVDPVTSTVEPSCDPVDGEDACIACIKAQACTEFKACFGEEPTSACGVGQTEGSDGQFLCISKCFAANEMGSLDEAELLGDCAVQCNDCPGEINDETNDLITVANDPGTCQEECFPFE
jgi:hypothetical protein